MRVLQFPASRRLAEVRRCALHLKDLHGEEANRFWRTEMIDFVAAMKSAGAEEEEIRREAGGFLSAVQIELELMADCEAQASR